MTAKSTLIRAAHALSQSNPEFRRALASELKKTGALDAADFDRHVTAHILNDKAFVKRTQEWVKSWFKQNKLPEPSAALLESTTKEFLVAAEPQKDKIQRVMASALKDFKSDAG